MILNKEICSPVMKFYIFNTSVFVSLSEFIPGSNLLFQVDLETGEPRGASSDGWTGRESKYDNKARMTKQYVKNCFLRSSRSHHGVTGIMDFKQPLFSSEQVILLLYKTTTNHKIYLFCYEKMALNLHKSMIFKLP